MSLKTNIRKKLKTSESKRKLSIFIPEIGKLQGIFLLGLQKVIRINIMIGYLGKCYNSSFLFSSLSFFLDDASGSNLIQWARRKFTIAPKSRSLESTALSMLPLKILTVG